MRKVLKKSEEKTRLVSINREDEGRSCDPHVLHTFLQCTAYPVLWTSTRYCNVAITLVSNVIQNRPSRTSKCVGLSRLAPPRRTQSAIHSIIWCGPTRG